MNLNPQFFHDAQGRLCSVLLPYCEYCQLIEELEDKQALKQRENEANISHKIVRRELIKNGVIHN